MSVPNKSFSEPLARTPGCEAGISSRWFLRLALVLSLVAAPCAGLAEPESAEEILRCSRNNLPATAVELLEVVAYDRAGEERTLEAKLHYKRFEDEASRVRARVENPSDLRGAAYLLMSDSDTETMYMYLPNARKTRRITGGMMSSGLWGTDFSYEDFQQIQTVAGRGSLEREADAEVGGRPTWVLESRPPSESESSYVKIRWFIDRESCIALRIDFHQQEDEVFKRLTAPPEEFVREGERWVARLLRIEDLVDGTQSTMRIVEADYGVEIPDRVFSPKNLGRAR